MDHLDDLVLDVGRLGAAVAFGGRLGRADEHVAVSDLATAVGLAVIAGETFHQHAGEVDLAQHVHVLVGNEGVFKNDDDFLAAVIRVAHVHLAGFQLAGVAGLTAIDVKDAGVIGGDGEGHGIVPVFRAHGLRGHDEDLMGVKGAGLVHLGAAHHDAVLAAFHHAQEHVGILLGVGREATVALGVGHGAVHSPSIS